MSGARPRSSRTARSRHPQRENHAMRARLHPGFVLGFLISTCATARTHASQPDVEALQRQVDETKASLEALRKEYEARIAALEERLEKVRAAPPAETAPLGIAPPAPPSAAGPQTANYFNPSISVIGNFLAVAGHDPVAPLPNAELRESEVGLQAI